LLALLNTTGVIDDVSIDVNLKKTRADHGECSENDATEKRRRNSRLFSTSSCSHPSFLASSPFFTTPEHASRKLETELTA
jgi:hypothetical protein